MAIIKKGSSENFMLMQRHPLQRPDMSMRAKGLLAYLMSLPQDWVIHRTELVSHFKDGKDAVFAALNELIDLGYVVRQQERGARGKFAEVNYTASDVLLNSPQTDLPVADKPVTDLPVTVNPHLQRNIIQSNSNTKKDNTKTSERRPSHPVGNYSNSEMMDDDEPQQPSVNDFRQKIAQSIADNNIDHLFGVVQLEKLMYYITDDGLSVDLVTKAIERTKEFGGRNYSYTEKMLENWRSQHIFTVQALNDYEKQIQGVKNKYSKNDRDKEIW